MSGLLFVDVQFEKRRCRQHTVEELRALYRDVRDFKREVETTKKMEVRTADQTFTAYAHARFQSLRGSFHPLDERLKLIDSDGLRFFRNCVLENFSNALTVKRKDSLKGKMGSTVGCLEGILDEIQCLGVEIQVQDI